MWACSEFVRGWNSIPKYGHEPIRLAARQVRECVVSHPTMSGLNSIHKYGHESVRLDRTGERATPERTAPESDRRDVERQKREIGKRGNRPERQDLRKRQNLAERVRICWSSEGKTHLSRLGERHLVAGVLGFAARLVAGVVRVWLPWFLLGQLVLQEGADVEPRDAAR